MSQMCGIVGSNATGIDIYFIVNRFENLDLSGKSIIEVHTPALKIGYWGYFTLLRMLIESIGINYIQKGCLHAEIHCRNRPGYDQHPLHAFPKEWFRGWRCPERTPA